MENESWITTKKKKLKDRFSNPFSDSTAVQQLLLKYGYQFWTIDYACNSMNNFLHLARQSIFSLGLSAFFLLQNSFGYFSSPLSGFDRLSPCRGTTPSQQTFPISFWNSSKRQREVSSGFTDPFRAKFSEKKCLPLSWSFTLVIRYYFRCFLFPLFRYTY